MVSRFLNYKAKTLPTEGIKNRSAVRNGTEEMRGNQALVPDLIALRAAADPNKTAVVAGDRVLTYSSLERRANQLAHNLHSIGIRANDRVAICLSRSVELVVAALAVLKAGGGYVPLDPAFPEERLAWMLNDAQPSVLITGRSFAQRLPDGRWRTVSLDRDSPQPASCPTEPLECAASTEDLAYIIYTSGSTGRPKGVEIAHKSVLNLVLWHQRAFEVTPLDRASQLASPGFDATVWEVWPYLAAGATLHLASDDIRGNPEALRDWIVSERITIGFAPTPLAERMIALEWPSETVLRALLTGADVLHSYPSPSLPFILVNNYGPTECTVVATSGSVSPTECCAVRPSIGRPISNVQVHIVDEHGHKVPDGIEGEIYIGGAGIARGYLNAPDLTAAKFVPDPYNPGRNNRLYRTGDLGYYLPDGQIAFVGRLDEQVKIRGYRVEPNEIVTALSAHPMVHTSVVTAGERALGEKYLIAYIVPKPGTHPTDERLREFLRRQLPDYMVPSLFVRIESLPVNTSGKIDRTRLPIPHDLLPERADSHVPPRAPIEQRIAEIVARLVNVERIGVHDNFFLLGGHSLLGTQLIARTRDAFGVELTLRALFDAPTIEALAAEVERLLYARLDAMTEDEAAQFLQDKRESGGGGLVDS